MVVALVNVSGGARSCHASLRWLLGFLVSCLRLREGLPKGPFACRSLLAVYEVGLLTCFLGLRGSPPRCAG